MYCSYLCAVSRSLKSYLTSKAVMNVSIPVVREDSDIITIDPPSIELTIKCSFAAGRFWLEFSETGTETFHCLWCLCRYVDTSLARTNSHHESITKPFLKPHRHP